MIGIPINIKEVLEKLEASGFEAFVVGGCVRDLLLGVEPQDWDITTNAKPEEIQKIFPDSVYENQFGTVGVKTKISNSKFQIPNKLQNSNSKNQKNLHDSLLKKGSACNNCNLGRREEKGNFEVDNKSDKYEIVEVTTYRIESKYTDKRHPDKIKFAETLEEDLSRRDFTINAIALKIPNNKSQITNKLQIPNSKNRKNSLNLPPKKGDKKGGFETEANYQLPITNYQIIDLFGGKNDLEKKIIRAVGDANERFDEDALRMMRAIRFVCTQNKTSNSQFPISNKIPNSKFKKTNKKENAWQIEEKTFDAIKKNAENLKYISQERIRDELNKIILSNQPARGIDLLVQTKLMKYIMPEIGRTIGVKQNRHHYYGPYNTVYAHMLASLEKCPSDKLEVRLAAFLHDIGKPMTKQGEGELATFYGHEYVGARITVKILERLKYPKKVIDKTVLLVKNHMFYYNVDEVGEAGVRRVVKKVGLENINDLIDVRIADRLGSGVPKAVPYKLRHFKYMVEKVSKDAISVKQLKINGNDLMKELKIKPGPKIGAILDVLLAYVIDNPEMNNKKELFKIAKKLEKKDLIKLRELAKDKIKEKKEEEEEEIKSKYWVK